MVPRGVSAWSLGVRPFGERDLEELARPDRLERARGLVDTIDDLYDDEWSVCGTEQIAIDADPRTPRRKRTSATPPTVDKG